MGKINFGRAITYHLSWKVRFRDFLDGKEEISASEIVSAGECELGRWLYSEGMAGYRATPRIMELEEVHIDLHKTAERIFSLKQNGNVLAARQELLTMELVSMKLFTLLSEIEKTEK